MKIACKAFCLLFLGMFLTSASGGNLQLSREGNTDYVVITAFDMIPAEEFAAKELREHLNRVTGAVFSTRCETAADIPARGIYVGPTAFAAARGVDFAELGDEEWIIRSYGENLVLAGGRPRGTLNAVYEFLEEETGCRWFDGYMETIPSIPSLSLDALDTRGEPAFWDRHIFTQLPATARDWTVRARNKDTRPKPAQYGFGHGLGTHTFYSYSRNFPEDKPEYHAMNRAGERPVATSGHGPGQICLTHPGAREHVLGQLRERIASDRAAAAAEAGEGRRPRKSFQLNQNDTHWICQCAGCREIAGREEADSGPYLDFINYMADGIRDEYPDVLIEGWAYANTIKPPKTIRSRDNVIIRVIQLNAEWAIDAIARDDFSNWSPGWYPDLFRPRSHPVNHEATRLLVEWSRISRHIAKWDYWRQYTATDRIPTPYLNLRGLQSDLQLFRDLKVGSMFAEYEGSETNSFFWLTTWTGWKLMQDPDKDFDELVQIFMNGYYGPAAGKMTEYLNHLEDSIEAVPEEAGKISGMTATDRPYLTLDFFRTAQQLLDEAEALCGEGSDYLLNVGRERIPVDAAHYVMWGILKYQLAGGEVMPWDREYILERYKRNRIAQIERRVVTGNREALERHIQSLREASEGNMGRFLRPLESSEENNILANGDFSDGLEGWNITGGRLHVVTPDIDYQKPRKPGGASLRAAGEEGKQVFVSRGVRPVEGVKSYRLSGWMKKEGFTNAWQAIIQAHVTVRSADGSTSSRTFSAWSTNYTASTIGWRFGGREFSVAEDEQITSIVIQLFTRHPGGRGPVDSRPNRGTVWFDNIMLEPVIAPSARG